MSRPNLWQGFLLFLKSLVGLLPPLRHFCKVLKRICRALCRWLRRRGPGQRSGCRLDIPPTEYKRPDPLLYAQFYLMNRGLAVTWDNPDIQLYDGEVAVSSANLQPDHDYQVIVRVWNNSYDAPAPSLPVSLSYLTFGVGTTLTPIDKKYVDLGVKGTVHCPAFAQFTWHTPATSGHYCLQARLDWSDDANPNNNLGQENTNVGQMHSPAAFDFTVRNDAGVPRLFQIEADMYQLPVLAPCSGSEGINIAGKPGGSGDSLTRLAESAMRWAEALASQGYGQFPLSGGWQVTIAPNEFGLVPYQERLVHVEIDNTSGNVTLPQSFNIQVFASGVFQQRQFVGGVTLTVEEA